MSVCTADPSAQLLSLPPELLLDIAECLGSNHDLNALLQSCRYLYNLLNSHLYQLDVKHHHSSALWWSVDKGRKDVAQRSLDAGADPNAVRMAISETEESALYGACVSRSRAKRDWERYHRILQVVKLLLERGADANYVQKESGYSPLKWSVIGMDVGVIQVLLDHGASVCSRGDPQDSLAHILLGWPGRAVNMKLLELLLDHGLDPNARDGEGSTVIHLISRRVEEEGEFEEEGMEEQGMEEEDEMVKVMELFLRYGADINAADYEFNAPLNIALSVPSSLSMDPQRTPNWQAAKLLLAKGADTSDIRQPSSGPVKDFFDQVSRETGRVFSFRTE
ncbi:hypothetical protein PRK78_005921 [Emydomyces testavorans]|uniref:F-box domain-containing protein n=1 Tax=Emydomyces testavorans TaxID=2070801 RepID=A0AAF0DKI0_9EURO|nr:hypothetical protein PRK78_005921 [Emydomyces testavorans]